MRSTGLRRIGRLNRIKHWEDYNVAFERDPNEVGSIWVNIYPDGAVKFGGKAFSVPDGIYRLENFTTKFKDGREGRGIRISVVDNSEIEAEKAPY